MKKVYLTEDFRIYDIENLKVTELYTYEEIQKEPKYFEDLLFVVDFFGIDNPSDSEYGYIKSENDEIEIYRKKDYVEITEELEQRIKSFKEIKDRYEKERAELYNIFN